MSLNNHPCGLVKNKDQQLLLEAQNLSFTRQKNKILDRVSIKIYQPEITTIIGPNGAGKSTLVKILLGIVKQDSGLLIKEQHVRLGYMPQDFNISQFMPITVAYFFQLFVHKKDKNYFDGVTDFLKIGHLLSKKITSLSGGERQKILLARALAEKPNVLVLDEPTANLDIQGQADFYHWIETIRNQYHCAILMVSHDLHWVMRGADQIICLNQHVCCSGHPHTIQHDDDFKNLFGHLWQEKVGFYQHHHDHQH